MNRIKNLNTTTNSPTDKKLDRSLLFYRCMSYFTLLWLAADIYFAGKIAVTHSLILTIFVLWNFVILEYKDKMFWKGMSRDYKELARKCIDRSYTVENELRSIGEDLTFNLPPTDN